MINAFLRNPAVDKPAAGPAASEAQTALGFQIPHFVLDDPKNVNRANNQGMPVVQYAPSAKCSRQLTDLALSLIAREGTR